MHGFNPVLACSSVLTEPLSWFWHLILFKKNPSGLGLSQFFRILNVSVLVLAYIFKFKKF
jgi:hypothetical protein